MKRWMTLTLTTLLGATACMSEASSDSPEAAEARPEPLIGGFPGTSRELDAVGSISLVWFDAESAHSELMCTGALLDEDTVLTARHCLPPLRSAADEGAVPVFGVGPKANDPVEWREIIGVEGAEGEIGGVAEQGHDVGVLHLARPFETARTVGLAALADTPLGTPFAAIGFGDSDDVPHYGTRRIGQVHLNATRGRAYEALFGSFPEFYEITMGKALPEACADLRAVAPNPERPLPDPLTQPCEFAGVLRYSYDSLRLEDVGDVVVGRSPGDAQVCFGDSGGPLVRTDAEGALIAYGVASTTARQGLDQSCAGGGVYASFTEDVLAFLRRAMAWTDPCQQLPAGGACEGDRVRRCTRMNEGPRRVVELDCRSLGLTCSVDTKLGATCAGAESLSADSA